MTKDIWKSIALIGIQGHPNNINRMADKIASLKSFDAYEIASSFGPEANKNRFFKNFLKAFEENSKVSLLEVAGALRAAHNTASMLKEKQSVEIVWTGPSTREFSPRQTDEVFIEVINAAKKKLFIVTFVAFNIEEIFEYLNKALDRNVKIDILVEPPKKDGGKGSDSSVKIFKEQIPRANIYTWDNRSDDFLKGCVHSKCIIADHSKTFITSANLTKAAMKKNIELGVLFSGGNYPEKLFKHFESLIIKKVIKKV